MILRCNSKREEKVCLRFYPCKNTGENISLDYVYKQKSLTIYHSDYNQFILKYLIEIYPISDPTDKKIVTHFDECFDNWIGKSDWKKITDKIKEKMEQGEFPNHVFQFYNEFITWIENNLIWCDLIMVEGNL